MGFPVHCPGRLAPEDELALVATREREINYDRERGMTKRAGSETIEVAASHEAYTFRPTHVAHLVKRAAKLHAASLTHPSTTIAINKEFPCP